MLKVMLVDDEEWCLEELAEILGQIGNVELTGTYNNAANALEAAARDAPNVVFIDVQMPGMSGLDLAKRLKQLIQKLYIVLISEKESFARNGFDIGVDDYILKPIREERVIMTLGRTGNDQLTIKRREECN